MRPIKISEKLNFVAVKLRMQFGDTELAVGTGFFYRFMGSTHLVTNWHNVSGKHPETGKCLHSEGGIPDRVAIGFPMNSIKDEIPVIQWDWRVLNLYDDENMEKPVWNEHPIFQHRIDVVTIPISELEKTAVLAANEEKLGLDRLQLRPGLDVFILGFPIGISGGAHFPIWKRGSIATEPDVDIDGLPKLYVDTATREGMSGSPVFAQETGFWTPEDKDRMDDAVLGTGRRFLGIYSGRVGNDPFKAQLGVVWKVTCIEEIIKNGLIKDAQQQTG
jgi:hypothetical protein